MQIQSFAGKAAAARTDLIVVGIFADGWQKDAGFVAVNRALKGALIAAAKEEDFSAKEGSQIVVTTLGRIPAKRVALVGLGRAEGAMPWLVLGATASRLGNTAGAKHVTLVAPKSGNVAAQLERLAHGASLGAYRYDRYRSDKGRAATVRTLALGITGSKASQSAPKAIKRGVDIAAGVELARDLVNEPANDLYPESFAKRIVAMARKAGLKTKVFGTSELIKMKMNLLLGVGAGSARTPRLVHMIYEPKGTPAKAKPVVLVGKGITFDSGGLCLKPAAGMMDMKADMGGAAAVVGAMYTLSKLKPKMPVHGIVALAENMPSGTAIRLGDVIKAASGRTVEINNTDAEGRLVLADALHYATKLGPKRIIDLATLTGACVVALGPYTTGMFTDNDKLAEEISKSADEVGESFWRLPLNRALKDQLKSDVADTKNTGQRYGGAITAGLFLSEFVGKTPWAHLDIAGPAMSEKDEAHISKGGTGAAVATLAQLLA